MRDSIIRFTKDRTGGSNDIITVPKRRRHVHRTQVAVTTAVFVMKINKTQNKPLFLFLTTTMSSASQIDRATMSEDRLVEMLSKMKSSREAEALRARLPAQLAPFASNMSIVETIQTVCTNPTDGVYCYSCEVDERTENMHVGRSDSAPAFTVARPYRGTACEAFGTRLARLLQGRGTSLR